MKKVKVISICFSLLINSLMVYLISFTVSAGSSYYVSTIGNDSTGDGSIGNPWLTIQKGIDNAVAGDTVYIRGGSYVEYVYGKNSGTAGNPITITGYQEESVIMEGTGASIPSGLAQINLWTNPAGVSVSYITIKNIKFYNSTKNAIRCLHSPTNIIHGYTIENCEFKNVEYRALYFHTTNAGTYPIYDIYVANCTFENVTIDSYPDPSAHESVTIFGVHNFTLRDSTFVNCPEIIIDLLNNTENVLIHNNTFDIADATVSLSQCIYLSPTNADVEDEDIYVRNVTISNNRMFTTGQGIKIGTEESGYIEDVTIVNNVIYLDGGGSGINIHKDDADADNHIYNLSILHNTIHVYDVSGAPFRLNIPDAYVHNFVVANNIFTYLDTTTGEAVYSSSYPSSENSELHFHNNTYYNYGGTTRIDFASGSDVITDLDPQAVVDDPDYVSVGTDFSLDDTSPCIDVANITYAINTDYLGVSRPQGDGYDIGAYEYSSEEPEPPSGDGYQYWNVTIADSDGDTTSGTIVCSDGSSTSWTSEANGTQSLNMSSLEYGTNYTVWLNYTDGECSITETYWFWTEFENEPNSPTSFTATTDNQTIIDLTWTKGINTDKTYIRYKQGNSAPTDRDDGTFLYNDTGTSTSATELSSGTEYSFKAWGWNETTSTFSTLSATDSATTLGDAHVTIRNDGMDFFVWLGTNTTAYYVVANLTGFDDASEYIAIWNNGTWSDTDGNWVKYYGDESGTNFNIHTFDVVSIYMVDVPMSFPETQNYYMNYNQDMDYERSYTHLWLNNSVTYGYNYTGYNKVASTTLGDISTSASLQTGEAIAIWNKSTYTWNWYLVGFWTPSVTVDRWDVILSKVSDTRTWNT